MEQKGQCGWWGSHLAYSQKATNLNLQLQDSSHIQLPHVPRKWRLEEELRLLLSVPQFTGGEETLPSFVLTLKAEKQVSRCLQQLPLKETALQS